MSQYFPKPNSHFSVNVKFELDLANYETLVDIRKAIDVKKFDLTNIKPDVDKSDIGK